MDAGFPRERRFSLPSISRRKLMPALAVATCAVVAVSVVGLNRDGGRRQPLADNDAARRRRRTPSRRPTPRSRPRPSRRHRPRLRPRPRAPDRALGADVAPGARTTGWRRPARASWTPPSATAATCSARRWAPAQDEGGGTYELRVPAGRPARRAARPRPPGHRALAEPERPGRDRRLRLRRRPAAVRPRRAPQPAPPPGALGQRHPDRGPAPPAGAERAAGVRPPRPAARPAGAHRLRRGLGHAELARRRRGHRRHGDGLGGALDDALGSLSDSVELLVRALGVAIPVGVLALLAWLAARTLRRRRREAILRPSARSRRWRPRRPWARRPRRP